jgi:hypothetical protein
MYLKFKSFMDVHGTPSLFDTFTCNLAKPHHTSVLDAIYGGHDRPLRDAVLIAKALQKKLSRFFSSLFKTMFATRFCGGLTRYCQVVEFQSRGLPHVHFYLWTHNTIKVIELIIAAELGLRLSELVERDQQRECGQCYMVEGACRVGYPRDTPAEGTAFDERTNRHVYQRRNAEDMRINPDNADIP